MSDLLTAIGLVALAELGDKSQLLALTFASRHRWWQVLAGVAVAATVLLGVASALGGALGASLPARPIAIGGGLVFLGFAAWTWREASQDENGEDADDHDAVAARRRGPVVVTVVLAFLVAELGDKTMLSTAALASTLTPVPVWIGASIGMTAASGAAILVGRALGRRLPARRLHRVSAAAFALFGVLLLVDGVVG